jgi:hypothetical protein
VETRRRKVQQNNQTHPASTEYPGGRYHSVVPSIILYHTVVAQ